jgi:hypothetical protein
MAPDQLCASPRMPHVGFFVQREEREAALVSDAVKPL